VCSIYGGVYSNIQQFELTGSLMKGIKLEQPGNLKNAHLLKNFTLSSLWEFNEPKVRLLRQTFWVHVRGE
jgi:hypothetical protein